MTLDDIKRIFTSAIKGEFLTLPNGSRVEVEFFADLFASAPNNTTYEDLMNIDKNEMGYKPFFDQCKAEGILN